MVLGCAALLSPPFAGLLLSRIFPYASLTDLSFLEVPGFIAGVTNPVSSFYDYVLIKHCYL